MTRLIATSAALAALLFTSPSASAENYDSPVQQAGIHIDSWGPKSGPPGTEVTITGHGFTRRTRVLIGGVEVERTRLRRTEIAFVIPDDLAGGRIVLREKGRPDVAVGRFSLDAPPIVKSFSPVSGVVGTRVEIKGRRLKQVTRALIGSVPATIVTQSKRRMVIEIPRRATSGYLWLESDHSRIRTEASFEVVGYAPELVRFAPVTGPAGTRVRLFGTHFGRAPEIYYGRTALEILHRGRGWIDVQVPETATKNQFFRLRNESGNARSTERFSLEYLPTVSKVSQYMAAPGTKIHLFGTGFVRGDRVLFGGQWANVVRVSPTRLVFSVPAQASGSELFLVRGDQRVQVPGTFGVGYAPVVTEWGPRSGPAGTRVVIRGDYLDGTRVYYGRTLLEARSRRGKLVVRIPEGPGQRLRVANQFGAWNSARPFELIVPQYEPEFTGFHPQAAYPGAELQLSGERFPRRVRIYYGNQRLQLLSWSENMLRVKLPRNLSGENWLWIVGDDTRLRSPAKLDILEQPTFDSYSPRMVRPGGQVVIHGNGFTAQTRVRLGRRSLAVISRSPTELTVAIPQNIRRTRAWLWVQESGHSLRSPGKLAVRGYARLTGMNRSILRHGQTLTLTGRDLHDGIEVYFGNRRLQVERINASGTRMSITVPRGVYGLNYVYVVDGDHRSRAPKRLRIMPRVRVRKDGYRSYHWRLVPRWMVLRLQ